LAGFSTSADPDLWGNVRFGLDILRDRSLPTVDPYSFTANLPWMNHEWLSEALMAFVYQLGGTLGLLCSRRRSRRALSSSRGQRSAVLRRLRERCRSFLLPGADCR
jgi:hypothetical protein